MTPSDLLDLTTLRNLVELDDGSHGLLREMIAIFRDDTPRRIQDILAAVVHGNAEELSRAGHALKGGAGALGANAMRNLAGDLEVLGRNGSAQVDANLADQLEAIFRDSIIALEAYVQEGEAGRG